MELKYPNRSSLANKLGFNKSDWVGKRLWILALKFFYFLFLGCVLKLNLSNAI